MPRKLFIAAGHDGSRVVSEDGKTWSTPELGKEGEIYKAVAFGNGCAIALGSYGGDNLFARTVDGQKWTSHREDAKYSRYIRGVVFGQGAFFALGGDPGNVALAFKSEDGEKWAAPREIAGKNMLRRATFGNGIFVAVGDRGRRSSSRDGLVWTDPEKPKATDTLIDIAFGNGVFVGVGLHGLRMLTTDGVRWTDRTVGEEGEHLNSIVWAKDRFVAIGAGATYSSANGVKWARTPNRDAPTAVAYGNGIFVGILWKGRLVRSTDGSKWEEVLKADRHLEAIAYGELP